MWDIYQKYLNTGRIDLFGTGNETRDFIHISDILRALELILGYQGPEEIFNVANGEEVSIRELAEIYAAQLGEKTDIVRFNGETKVGFTMDAPTLALPAQCKITSGCTPVNMLASSCESLDMLH